MLSLLGNKKFRIYTQGNKRDILYMLNANKGFLLSYIFIGNPFTSVLRIDQ
jgi:hypothetical protein